MRSYRTEQIGAACALIAVALFGASTPLDRVLLAKIDPWLLAALLYLGSGIGLCVARILMRSKAPTLTRADWLWLLLTVLLGGIVAPVLLVFGLQGMPGSGASLLLNAEAVLTAVIAWVVFKENLARTALGRSEFQLSNRSRHRHSRERTASVPRRKWQCRPKLPRTPHHFPEITWIQIVGRALLHLAVDADSKLTGGQYSIGADTHSGLYVGQSNAWTKERR